MTGYKLKYILKATRKGSAHHIFLVVCKAIMDKLINTVAVTVNVGHDD